jgi:cyclic nucleotide gated channel
MASIYLQIRLFTMKDCPIWDALCHNLKHNLYISGSDIICQGRPVEKVIFIVRGKLESIAADGSKYPLHKGAVCGEELLMWYLEQPSVNRSMHISSLVSWSCICFSFRLTDLVFEYSRYYIMWTSIVSDRGAMEVDRTRWMSIRTIRCLTNVEAFVLQTSDLEKVALEYSRFLCNPFVIAAIR